MNSNRKNNGLLYGSVVAVCVAVLVGIVAMVSARNSHSNMINNLNLGNRYLADMDYEQAIASYKAVLEIDPKNADALSGLMQAAFSANDLDTLQNAFEQYQNSGTTDPDLDKMAEQSRQLLVESSLSDAADLIAEGDYDKAMDIVNGLKDNPYVDMDTIRAQLNEKLAERAWKARKFDEATKYLENALSISDNENIKNHLLRVTEGYINDCISHQDYGRANELIEWIQSLYGDDVFSEYENTVADMAEFDDSFQSQIEELNTAFENDDIKLIEELMNSKEFKDEGQKIRTVFYSNSLKNGDKPEGSGTAVYNVDGTLYVYYGSFANGLRNGSGLYYHSTDKGHLDKYSLNWVDDLPQGPGIEDSYGTMTTKDHGVVIGTKETKDHWEFYLVDGIYDGTACEEGQILGGDGYSYELTFSLSNGYAERILPGNYPERINEVEANPNLVLASWGEVQRRDYWGDYYTSYVWWDWSGGKWQISGLQTHNQNAAVADYTINPLG